VHVHTIVCSRSAITNRARASVWAFAHTLTNVDLAVETLFSNNPRTWRSSLGTATTEQSAAAAAAAAAAVAAAVRSRRRTSEEEEVE